MDNKVCKIINGKFLYALEVDNCRIPFQTILGAVYFEEHYSSLGYTILKINENDNLNADMK